MYRNVNEKYANRSSSPQISPAVAAFSQSHPYEFLPSVFPLRASVSLQRLRNIRKHCYSVETISVRDVCVMAFFQPGPVGHTVWGKQSKKPQQQLRKRQRERKGDKGNMNSRLLALSCLHAGFSVQRLSAGLY